MLGETFNSLPGSEYLHFAFNTFSEKKIYKFFYNDLNIQTKKNYNTETIDETNLPQDKYTMELKKLKPDINASDNTFCNLFLESFKSIPLQKNNINSNIVTINSLLNKSTNETLENINNPTIMIIDMQYDFYQPGNENTPPGNFYVAEGDKLLNSDPSIIGEGTIFEIINNISIKTKDKINIINTIDYHPSGHCSFTTNTSDKYHRLNTTPPCGDKSGYSGNFPSHCIIKGEKYTKDSNNDDVVNDGSHASLNKILIDSIEKLENTNILYTFKGFNLNHDSFGALSYYDGKNNYIDLTINTNPIENEYDSKQSDDEKYIPDISTLEKSLNNVNRVTSSDESSFNCSDVINGSAYFSSTSSTKTNIDTSLNDTPSDNKYGYPPKVNKTELCNPNLKTLNNTIINDIKNDNIRKDYFIVGLAGDYCCLDTVLNLQYLIVNTIMNDNTIQIQDKINKLNNINIYYSIDHIRQAWLPSSVIPDKLYNYSIPTGQRTVENVLKSGALAALNLPSGYFNNNPNNICKKLAQPLIYTNMSNNKSYRINLIKILGNNYKILRSTNILNELYNTNYEETKTNVNTNCSMTFCTKDICRDGKPRREINGKCCQCPSETNS